MENCIFCKIIAGEIPSPRVYEDDKMIVINDIAPKAKKHYLCIPKEHFALLSEMDEKRAEVVAHCFRVAASHQAEWGLENGYRAIINQGADGGQAVAHLHIHILGGEVLKDF